VRRLSLPEATSDEIAGFFDDYQPRSSSSAIGPGLREGDALHLAIANNHHAAVIYSLGKCLPVPAPISPRGTYDQRVDGSDVAAGADQRVDVEFTDKIALVGDEFGGAGDDLA